ncbi:methionyl-tRNA formyltransferase [Candidatus Nomurabacteria bacterium]|nr:methionyl-tRNA formyltransferase [Candidatus Nomurabacteria bacterium]
MNNNISNFCFLGTPFVSSDTLKTLCENNIIPGLVITSPDKPAGRGMKLTPSPTKTLALEKNIEVYTPEKIDADFIEKIKSKGFDFAIVVAYGKILPQDFIDIFPKGVINIHYSLLPKYRGASPTEAALLHSDTTTGVTIQKMVFKLDAGDIIAQKSIDIEHDDTTITLRPKLITLGANLLVESLPKYLNNEIELVSQDESIASKCGKISKEDGDITNETDENIKWNKYRAYAEWPRTYFIKDGKRYIVSKARFENNSFVIEKVIPEGKKETDYIS